MKSRILIAVVATLALAACSDQSGDPATGASGAPSSTTSTGTTASAGAGSSASAPSTDPSASAGSGSGNVTAVDALVTFTRTGGIAGTNDKLSVGTDGAYSITTKAGTKTGKLAADELNALKAALASTDFNKMPTMNDGGSVRRRLHLHGHLRRQADHGEGRRDPARPPARHQRPRRLPEQVARRSRRAPPGTARATTARRCSPRAAPHSTRR